MRRAVTRRRLRSARSRSNTGLGQARRLLIKVIDLRTLPHPMARPTARCHLTAKRSFAPPKGPYTQDHRRNISHTRSTYPERSKPTSPPSGTRWRARTSRPSYSQSCGELVGERSIMTPSMPLPGFGHDRRPAHLLPTGASARATRTIPGIEPRRPSRRLVYLAPRCWSSVGRSIDTRVRG